MLNKLSIKNVALIESAEIEFSDGFNVLSGETGAGKSVVIESLNFVLGAKADKSLVRSGTTECFVSAEFNVSGNEYIFSILKEFDFDIDDTLIIARKFSLDGKNSIKINGSTANVSMLKTLTNKLVSVHGQSEHYELLNENNQLKLIDSFGAEKIESIKEKIKILYDKRKEIELQLGTGGADESERLIRLDVLDYQIREIQNCNLKEGEENELLALKEKLANQEKILSALSAIKDALSGEGGADDIVANASRVAGSIASYGGEFSSLNDRLSNAYAELDDIAETASEILDGTEEENISLDEVENRLELIKSIKRKYGTTYQEIMSFLQKAEEEKEKLINYNEIYANLIERKKDIEKKLYSEYQNLSNERRAFADTFAKKVVKELKELGMDKASFYVAFDDLSDFEHCTFSASGIDGVSFMFSANMAEPPKPLSNIISGGEMSRFMLAIKSQSAKFDDISTYVFDEIDAGISGKTASVVAEKLYKISCGVQVLAITHLPQIAAFADNSIYIVKGTKDNRTVTSVKTLSSAEKVGEIVRLVGGDIKSDVAIKHAQNLIAETEEKKKQIKV